MKDKRVAYFFYVLFITFFAVAFPFGVHADQVSGASSDVLAKEAARSPDLLLDGQGEYQGEIDDPFEPFNRAMFEINYVLDTFILDPVANLYRFALPGFVQHGVGNMLSNLGTPLTMINSLLQGRGSDAIESFFRFLINSTLGFFGTIDVASELGLQSHKEDFGQTMGVWGAGPGPYLVLPLLGPSSGRDAIGSAVDLVSDPTNIAIRRAASKNYIYARMGVRAVSSRAANIEDYDALKKTSVDLYATMRSLYSQYRRGLIEEEKKNVETEGPEAYLDESF